MIEYKSTLDSGKLHRYTWENVRMGDEVQMVHVSFATFLMVQVISHLDSATISQPGRILMEGSLEESPISFFPLKDKQGDVLSFRTSNGASLESATISYVRPRVVAGSDKSSFTIILIARSG